MWIGIDVQKVVVSPEHVRPPCPPCPVVDLFLYLFLFSSAAELDRFRFFVYLPAFVLCRQVYMPNAQGSWELSFNMYRD